MNIAVNVNSFEPPIAFFIASVPTDMPIKGEGGFLIISTRENAL